MPRTRGAARTFFVDHGSDNNGSSGHAITFRAVPTRCVLIASPWSEVRRRWRRALAGRFRSFEAGTFADLEQLLTRFQPCSVVLDASLLPIDGMGALRRLSRELRLLVLSEVFDETEARAALSAGAHGYCRRDLDPTLIRRAVETLRRGGMWVGHHPLAVSPAPPTAEASGRVLLPGIPPLGHLTSREREVAALVGGGARNKEIADRLSITEATVKAHLTAVFRKLAVSDRLHLVLMLAETKSDSSRPVAANR